MPTRLSKRQQRELDELETLGNPDGSGEEEPLQRTGVVAATGFSNFLTPEGVDEGESEDEGSVKPTKSRKKKKKKPKVSDASKVDVDPSGPTRPAGAAATPPPPPPPAKNEKKALKKARAKEKKSANDELDQALAELSAKYPELRRAADTAPGTQSLADLLSVSVAHLDSEAEMRKFFGAKVVQANKEAPSGVSGSSAAQRRQAGSQRSNLTRPQPSWWASKQREGLSIRPLTEEELGLKLARQSWNAVEEKWWTVEYDRRYKSVTKAFLQIVMSGDPEGFWKLLGRLPWHADTLLQLSEVYRHREEYGPATDFVDRALFAYERSFVGAFNFTGGVNRLDFDHVENRPFFLAIHRQVADLQRRGCVRTAFEFARLLYSLDPWNDPHGALYHLDLLAVKAGMTEWLLKVYDIFTARREHNSASRDARMDPSLLPGWAYTRALALKIQEDANKGTDHTASTAALEEAVSTFPSIVPLLADKLELSLPASIRGHPNFKIETDASSLSAPTAVLHLLSHLYAQRSFGIWKDAEHSAWFAHTVTNAALPTSAPVPKRREAFLSLYQNQNQNLCYSAYRHVIVLESTHRRLFSFLPRQVRDAKSLACDPLPPLTAATGYDREFFEDVDDIFAARSRTRQERAADERRLAQIIPDAAFRHQLEAFFEAHPRFADRFPGGILQFAQVAGQLPEEVLEDMMLVEVMGDAGDAGGMPGHMPGEEPGVPAPPVPRAAAIAAAVRGDVEVWGTEVEGGDAVEGGSDGDDDSDTDDEVSPMPRMLRNLIGRFWGRTPPAVEDDSSDEEPVDAGGVD